MNFRNLREDTIEKIKILSISGSLIVLFYLAVRNFNSILSVLGATLRILSPFLFGIAFAFILAPLRKVIELELLKDVKIKEKTKRRIAVLICFLVLLFALFSFIGVLVPQLTDSISKFIESMDGYVATIQGYIEQFNGDNTHMSNFLTTMLTQAGTKLTEWLTGAQGGLSRLVSYSISLLRTVFNFFVGVIISIYLLMDEEKFRRQIKSIIYAFTDSDKADRVVEITRLTGKTFNSFIFGKFIDSLIIGVITYFVLMIMKMPYAPLISFVVGVTNMIPVFGPFIGAVPSIIILLIINPWKALEFAIFIFILQQIDGNIIGPRILGDAVGLPTLWVMFAIIVGGALFGAVGMFVGVPVFSVIYVLLGKIIENNLAKKEIDLQTTREIKMRQ